MERFQKKKPNKEDHKKTSRAASIINKGAKVIGVGVAVGVAIKTHGKDIVGIAKNAILKR